MKNPWLQQRLIDNGYKVISYTRYPIKKCVGIDVQGGIDNVLFKLGCCLGEGYSEEKVSFKCDRGFDVIYFPNIEFDETLKR